MMRTRRALATLIGIVLLAASMPAGRAWADGAAPQSGLTADARPAELRDVGIEPRLHEQVPLDLALRDENGRAVTIGDYLGQKPVILSLVYYDCPMLCTLVLNGLVRALRTLTFDVGKEFAVVTVSFDPRETHELAARKKATYIAEYGRDDAAAGWHFLTGDAPEIERLARTVGFRYTYLPDAKEYAHGAAIMVLTPEGRLSRYFYGVEYSPRDLRLGLVEAARGEIGSAVDAFLLYCYRYDPHTGAYSMMALTLVRLGGIATVLALAAFVLVMRRRERAAEAA